MAVINYTTMPDAATQAAIKARGDTINIVPAAGASAANPSGTSITSPYQQGLTETGPKPGGGTLTQPLNAQQYATPTAANQIASMYGGTVGGGQAATGSGPITLPNTPLTVSMGGTPQNAGAVAAFTNAYGPQQTANLFNSGLTNAGMKPTSPVSYTPSPAATGPTPSVPQPGLAGGPSGGTSTDLMRAPGAGYRPPMSRTPVTTPGTPTAPSPPPPVLGQTIGTAPRYPSPGTSPGGTSSGGGLPSSGTASPTSPFPYSSTAQANTSLSALPSYAPPTGPGTYPSIPGGYQSPVVTSGDQGDKYLADKLESDRQLALSQGQGLINQFQTFSGTNANRSAGLQGQLASAYAPLGAGQGGYTPQQIQDIERTGQLDQLPTSASALQSNYLTPEEQASITANPQAGVQAFQQGATGLQGTLGGTQANVNQQLESGAAGVNQYIDPTALNLSPQAQQDIITKAGNQVRVGAQAQDQQLQNEAFQAGNVSPLALAAARNRIAQTGEVGAADAMTDARLQAEMARLGAAQTYANLGTQNAQEIAQRGAGAQLELGAQGLGTGQFLTGAGINTAQTADQAASARVAQEATNRQNVNVTNQQTQFQQGMDINQLESGRANTVANANLQAGQEYRQNYLQGQEQEANQNTATGGQQEIGAFQSQMGAANQAGSSSIANKVANQTNPGTPTNILFHAKGGIIRGPRLAMVGEKFKPEAIVPIGPPKSGGTGTLLAAPRFKASPRIGGPTPIHTSMPAPHYGIPSSSLGRTLTRSGYQRILPQFDSGGVVTDNGQESVWNPTPEELAAANAGLTDQNTNLGPSGLRRAASIAAMVALGSKYPGLAGVLGDRIAGTNDSDSSFGKDVANAAAKDTLRRRAPGLANRVTGSGLVQPPASPANDARNATWNNSLLPEMRKFTPYAYNPEDIFLGGGGQKQSAPPVVGVTPRKEPGARTPAPPPPAKPKQDNVGQTHTPPPDDNDPRSISYGPPDTGQTPKPPATNPPAASAPPPPPPDPGSIGSSDSTFHPGTYDPGKLDPSLPPGIGDTPVIPPPPDDPTLGISYGPPDTGQSGSGETPGEGQYGGIGSGEGEDSGSSEAGGYPNPWGGGNPPVDQGSGTGYLPPDYASGSGSGSPVDPGVPGGGGAPPDPNQGGFDAQFNPYTPIYQADGSGGAYGGDAGDGGDGSYFGGGYARGGVFAPHRMMSRRRVFAPPQSPYGPTKVVSQPTLLTLGQSQPQAVIPLTPNPKARVTPADVPRLIRRYGNR